MIPAAGRRRYGDGPRRLAARSSRNESSEAREATVIGYCVGWRVGMCVFGDGMSDATRLKDIFDPGESDWRWDRKRHVFRLSLCRRITEKQKKRSSRPVEENIEKKLGSKRLVYNCVRKPVFVSVCL